METITLRKQIRAAMIFKELTAGDIARSVGVTRSAICKVIEGKLKTRRLREVVAKAIDAEVKDLWPCAGEKP